MGFLSIIYIAGGALVATGLIQKWRTTREKQKVLNELKGALLRLEGTYKDLVRKQLMLLEMSKDGEQEIELAFVRIQDQAEKILIPDIESLYHTVEYYQGESLKINVETDIFHNVASWMNQAIQDGNVSKAVLFQAVRDAIHADVEKRLLNWKTGHSFLVD